MNELQEMVRAILPIGFLRRCKEPDALLISDAPRRCAFTDAQAEALQTAGFRYEERDGLLRISPDDALLKRQLDVRAMARLPHSETLLPIYQLACLLAAHPAAWERQPREPLLSLLKQQTLCELQRWAERELPQCAARLRRREPLPFEAACSLFKRINEEERS